MQSELTQQLRLRHFDTVGTLVLHSFQPTAFIEFTCTVSPTMGDLVRRSRLIKGFFYKLSLCRHLRYLCPEVLTRETQSRTERR